LIPLTVFVFASKKSAKQSPPIPVELGCVTFKAAAVATAASAAFPPCCKILIPISEANGCTIRKYSSHFLKYELPDWRKLRLGDHRLAIVFQ
jgi:hypothetical protein